jgi:hypothetical protein
MLPLAGATLSGGWAPVDMATDPVTSADAGRTFGMLRGARKCDHVGESITVRFNGSAVALTDIPGPDPIVIDVAVDGGQPVEAPRKEATRLYARYWWTPTLPPGDHTVVFTVKTIPPATAFYAGQLWFVGRPMR